MNSLLSTVLQAHGGISRWASLRSLRSEIVYGGPFWSFKGQAGFAGVEIVEADLQQQRISSTSLTTGRVVDYSRERDRVTITAADGTLLESLDHPRASFAGFGPETQWTPAQAAYFRSYATWHYLVEPYIFTWPGVETRELSPWDESGDTWRVLKVNFPASIDTHSDSQLYYFDESSRLRRMDYQPLVNGNSAVAHYITEHTRVDGWDIPTRRNIYLRNGDGTADRSWTPISLELRNTAIF
jgi:hypothetical protein